MMKNNIKEICKTIIATILCLLFFISILSCRFEMTFTNKIDNLTYEKYISLSENDIKDIIIYESSKILKHKDIKFKNLYYNKAINCWYGEIDTGIFKYDVYIEYKDDKNIYFTLKGY
jgi:hypothetical protein